MQARLHRQIRVLARDEWAVLARYVEKDVKTLNWPINHGPVNSLETQKILVRVSSLGHVHSFPYTTQPWFWKGLKIGKIKIPTS